MRLETQQEEAAKTYVSQAALRDELKPLSDDLATIKGAVGLGKFVLTVVMPIVAALITAAAILGTAIVTTWAGGSP